LNHNVKLRDTIIKSMKQIAAN